MENLVAIQLFRKQLAGEAKFFYWTDPQKAEADFVVFQNNRVEQLIQVCVDAGDPRTEEREVRGLLKASRALGCDDLLFLTGSTLGEQRETWHGMSGTIRRMPISEWLTAQSSAHVS